MKPASQLLFLGIDGASWDVIDSLISQGALPNFSKIIENGCRSTFRIEDPCLLSPILWTSIFSGVRPERHGVKDFFTTSHQVQVPRMWDFMASSGKRIGLFGLLVTWPPQNVPGFNVPLTASPGMETYPAGLESISIPISKLAKRGIRPSALGPILQLLRIGGSPLSLFPSICDLRTRNRYYLSRLIKWQLLTDIFMKYVDRFKTDANFFHIHLIDSISHRLWNGFDDKKTTDCMKEPLMRSYIGVDRIIGRILSTHYDSSTLLVIVSDHGFANERLSLKSCSVHGEGLLDMFKAEVGTEMRKKVRYFNHAEGSIMVTIFDSSVRSKFKEFLAGFTDLTGLYKVFEVETFISNHLQIKLTTVHTDDGVKLRYKGKLVPSRILKRCEKYKWTGYHSRQGSVVLLAGANVKREFTIENFSMVDILPTIFALLNVPIPRGLDGECVLDAIEPEYLTVYPPSYQNAEDLHTADSTHNLTEEEEAQLISRLRDLGYM